MFTKNFMGGGRVILWGKINPGKYLTGKFTPRSFCPIPQRKKKKQKRKLTPENIIS